MSRIVRPIGGVVFFAQRRFKSLLLAALLIAMIAPAAHASTVTVTLEAMGGPSVSQGKPYQVKVKLDNSDVIDQTVVVELMVAPVAGGAPVAFDGGEITVMAETTKELLRSPVSSQWFSQTGMYEISAVVDGAFADSLQFEVTAPSVVPVTFRDVTAGSGLAVDLEEPDLMTCPGTQAQGAAWADADNDGDLDLYVPNPSGSAQLWINDRTGHFADRAAQAGVTNPLGRGKGAAFADYDNDGDQDLYVVNIGANVLYQNDGTGRFTDVTASAGVGDTGRGTSASWGDYDNDGFVDLYATNYAQCDMVTAGPDKLYHNEGNGTFTDVTYLLEGNPDDPYDGSTMAAGFQAGFFDFDADGDQDIYLANDRIAHPEWNHLWRNNGDGTFTDISVSSGTDLSMGAMGLAFSDIDLDGDQDFTISQMTMRHGNVAFRNNGNETFTNVAAQAGVERKYQQMGVPSVTWGMGFYDFNLDGYEDVYFAAGATGMMDFAAQPNELFVSAGGGRFLDLSALSGAHDDQYGRAPVVADVNRDGLMDIFLVNQNDMDGVGSSIMYMNTTPATGHWLEIDTIGTASNRDGCGALVTLKIGRQTRSREMFCGSVGLASSNESIVHFGLGDATNVDQVKIRWPSGTVQTLADVAADQLLRVVEPG